MAKDIRKRLIKIDAENAEKYNTNLKALDIKLAQLQKDIKAQLAEFGSSSFANFSDTLQYFEKSQGLSQPIIIMPYHGARLSINKVLNAKKKMRQQNTACVLHTQEVSLRNVKVITEGMTINHNEISILGNGLDQGPEQYFQLMNNLTLAVKKCLQ